jgi:hypothetical protein
MKLEQRKPYCVVFSFFIPIWGNKDEIIDFLRFGRTGGKAKQVG